MSKKLWIFEKPNVAKAVISVLPKPHVAKNGYYETGDGIVTWAFGHIFEQLQPPEYDAKYSKWDLDILPVIPEVWKLKVSNDSGSKNQASIVKKFLKECDVIVNGGDPDREGQLLIDEILMFYNNKKPVLRYMCKANDKTSVLKAVQNLEDNNKYSSFRDSAIGRQRADWLIGMNMTMGMTSIAQKQQNFGGMLSIGRVQTPTLALIVQRDIEIEKFKPMTYFSLSAQFMENDIKFWTRWLPPGKSLSSLLKQDKEENSGEFEDEEEDSNENSENSAAWLKDSKIIDPAKAKEIFDKIKAAGKGIVSDYTKKEAREKQPLPGHLGDIQRKMNSKYGYDVSDTMKGCQALYEAGYASYPRTDCNYLPESQHGDSVDIFSAFNKAGIFEHLIPGADPKIKSACWDDSKVAEHHAIIPTTSIPSLSSLPEMQRRIYEEVVKNYIALFYPECIVDKTNIEITIAEERFSASGRVVKSPGWRIVFGADEEKQNEDRLPSLEKNQSVLLTDLKNEEKQTTPPPHYTQASLINIMEKIHRVLKNPEERKQMKDEGLGRPATRHGIVELLYRRGYVKNSGKYIISTDIGRALIKSVPKEVSSPSLTAQWEKALNMIFEKKITLEQFEKKQHEFINILLKKLETVTLPELPTVSYSKGKTSATKSSSGGGAAKKTTGKKCPQCKKGNLVTKTIKNGDNAGKTFKGCSNYPECKYTEWPKKK